MTDTSISDAVCFPQDEGTGVPDGSESFSSAGYFGLLARQADGEYVGDGLAFANVDINNDTVDVTAGHAFLFAESSTVDVQSGSQETYDTTLPTGSEMPYIVVLPADETGLGLDSAAVNDVWLFLDESSQDTVKLRHGSGLSRPAEPALKLGTVDTSDGSTTRASDDQRMGGGAGGALEVRVVAGEDGLFSGKTLESNESLTVATDESFVVSDDYTVESGATLTVNGSMTVM